MPLGNNLFLIVIPLQSNLAAMTPLQKDAVPPCPGTGDALPLILGSLGWIDQTFLHEAVPPCRTHDPIPSEVWGVLG